MTDTPCPGLTPGCRCCRILQLALLAALHEGARCPRQIIGLAQSLLIAWMPADPERLAQVLNVLTALHLVRCDEDGQFHLTAQGRGQFQALMADPRTGLDPLAIGDAMMRLSCLAYLPPDQRASVREEIIGAWRRGSEMLARAAAQQADGSLIQASLGHQVTLLDSMVGAFQTPHRRASART